MKRNTFRSLSLMTIWAMIVGVKYNLTFMPLDCSMPAREFKTAKVIECDKENVRFIHENAQYNWKNNKRLFKNEMDLGEYPFLLFLKSDEVKFPN